MKKSLRMVLAICIVSCGSIAAAQTTPTPKQVSEQYFNAIKENGMNAGVEFIHPDEQVRFKDMFMTVLNSVSPEARNGIATVILKTDTSFEDLKKMPPNTFMQLFLKSAQSKLKGVQLQQFKILGAIAENELMHVLARTSTQLKDLKIEKVTVMTLKRYQNTWKLMLSGELEGFGSHMQSLFPKKK